MPLQREKSKGSGDIAIPYQFSWNAISDLVVKFGSCRSLVPNTWPAQLLYSSPLLPVLHLCLTIPVLCQPLPVVVSYLVCANWLAPESGAILVACSGVTRGV